MITYMRVIGNGMIMGPERVSAPEVFTDQAPVWATVFESGGWAVHESPTGEVYAVLYRGEQ